MSILPERIGYYKNRNERKAANTLYLYHKQQGHLTGNCVSVNELVRMLKEMEDGFLRYRLLPFLENISRYYKSAAVIGNNKLAEYACRILQKSGMNFEHIKTPECFSETPISLSEPIEIILNMSLIPWKVTYRKKEVFIYNLRHSSLLLREANDFDIAVQIIPRLISGGVNVLLVSLPTDANLYGLQKTFLKRMLLMGRGWVSQPMLINMTFDVEKEYNRLKASYTKGYLTQADQHGKYYNVIDGMRYTCYNTPCARFRMMLFGPCTIFGNYVADCNTIASRMSYELGNDYNIENHGVTWYDMNISIRAEQYYAGDRVVIFVQDKMLPYYRNCKAPVLSLEKCFESIPKLEKHVSNELLHCDAAVDGEIARTLVDYMKAYGFLNEGGHGDAASGGRKRKKEAITFGMPNSRRVSDRFLQNPELKRWLSDICQYRSVEGKTGAIVMNCNPFTLGHRYLIERAGTQVDQLMVFVVEEDKSFFRFKDRIKMVRLGTADLKNVTVIPSGKYIISAVTLPGYFEKDENPDITFDATDDLDLFASVIAKELNISVRFAGEEPIDGYTRQYNQAMERVLPAYGIEFVQIPRKEWGGMVISASRVRRLMEEKKYEEIKGLVMPQIYDYLEEHYF